MWQGSNANMYALIGKIGLRESSESEIPALQ